MKYKLVTTVGTIAETPKDDNWYQLLNQENDTYIRWDFKKEIWRKMVLDENNNPLFADYLVLH